MLSLKNIGYLLQKDFRLEWRMQYALNGLLLYVGSTVFLVYSAFNEMEPTTWITIFWIILLFASANAVAKSFTQESTGRQLYYYSLVSPQSVIFSKIIYNFFLLAIITLLTLAVYSLLLGFPVEKPKLLTLIILLGIANFAAIFSMVSAIAFKASGNATLVPVLSFPILIPVIMLLIGSSKATLTQITDINLNQNLGTLGAIFVMVFAVSGILFPFLWKE